MPARTVWTRLRIFNKPDDEKRSNPFEYKKILNPFEYKRKLGHGVYQHPRPQKPLPPRHRL